MKTNCLLIIQARMGSGRLPGKSMCTINGQPSLAYLIESLLQCCLSSHIIVATTFAAEDDIIEKYCIKKSIPYYRGDVENVASRYYEIVKQHSSEYFIRISGDSPLFDYHIINVGLQKLESATPDIITTASSRPYPSGMNFEIICSETFLNAYPFFSLPEDFEHVTKYFYRNRHLFAFEMLTCPIENATRYKFSIDTTSDYKIISKIFDQMNKPHYNYLLEEKMKLFDRAVSILPNA